MDSGRIRGLNDAVKLRIKPISTKPQFCNTMDSLNMKIMAQPRKTTVFTGGITDIYAYKKLMNDRSRD